MVGTTIPVVRQSNAFLLNPFHQRRSEMKALITALSALSVLLARLVVSSAEAQEPDKAAPTSYKVADVVPGAISPDERLLSYTDWSTGDLALQDLNR